MNLNDFTKSFPCPGCGTKLPISVAKTGMVPGSTYVDCHKCSFHLMLPKATATPPAKSPVAQPAQEGRCEACPGPTRRPAHRECKRSMCKQCCIAREGCPAPKHQPQHLSLRQQQMRQLHPLPVALSKSPAALPPLQGFTSMQHILKSVPLPMQMLPPLNPSEMQALQDMRNSDPSISFFANEDHRQQEEQLTAEQERLIVQQEERDFQAGVATSLGLLTAVSITSPASTSHHPPPSLSIPIPQASSLTATTPNHLRTLPYRPPNITHHMNSDWMRPFKDLSKETPKRRKRDPNQRFRLVFWGEDDQPPVIRAVNDCPEWPMWSLVDALDIKQELALGVEPLQFYDFGHSQWISCTHSYPHELKKDGYLFLRRPSVTCLDFDTHATHAKGKMQHLFLNMPGERSAIKKCLQHRKANPPLVLIDLEDEEGSEVEFLGPPVRKRQRSESPIDIITSPQPRRRRLQSVSPQVSEDLTTISPPSLLSNSYGALVYVPESKKKWPDGTYTVDMAKAFLEVDSENFKKLRLKLPERLCRVFGKDIPLTTWHDQRRLWANGTERQRDEGVRAGRGAAGLWATFKARVSRN